MQILSRYFLVRFLVWFLAAFLLLCGVAVTTDLLIELERVRELGGGWLQGLVYLLLRLPAMHFPYLVPTAAFIAALFTLGTASLSLEVLAAKAGGVSPHRLVAPVLAGALALTALTAIVNETLVVRATRVVEQPEGRDGGDAPEIVFRGGSFWYHSGRTIYNIRRADPEAGTLHGVSVYERDARDRLVRTIHAPRATIEGPDTWRFHDATVRRFDPQRPGAAPEYERRTEIRLTVADDPELGVLKADPAILSLGDLRRYIAAREAEGEDVRPFRAMLHQRMAAPFSVFLFALLAVPAALQAERTRTLATPALQGVVLLVGYWFVHELGQMLSGRGLPHTEFAPFAVLALFLALGGVRLARVPV